MYLFLESEYCRQLFELLKVKIDIKFQNLKVAVIDTDPQGSLGQWFMIRSEKNISNQNLSFKTASLWGAQYESKNLKKDHDIVIIDTPP